MQEKDIKTVDQIIKQLQKVIDPELQVDIVNLGLIYGIEIEDNVVTIKMTLTVMGCPLSDYLDKQIKHAVLEIPQIKSCDVKLVWYPVWSPERMSRAARLQLGMKLTSEPDPNQIIDFNEPIKKYADIYPDFVEIMNAVGFTRIKIPGMLFTVGRVMSIKLGAQAMNIDLSKIKAEFEKRGYTVHD